MRSILLLIGFAAVLHLTSTLAAEANEDPLLVTSSCDEEKSRLTAQKLFAYVDNYFDKFKKVKPAMDDVSVAPLYEDGPDVEFHETIFSTFKAHFIREKNGLRVLSGLSTRSSAFKLPWGLKMGQSMERVQIILGPPTALSSRTLLYEIGGEAISDIYFYFEGDKLVEVSWNHGVPD